MLNPKCLNGMSCFASVDGKFYPCCFLYTATGELEDWANRYGHKIDDIDMKKHGYISVKNSQFYHDFYNSFDTETCRKECGEDSYDTEYRGKPKWTKYVSK
tara:strand:+ start:630 stop:932 length:303 start_codon:yes stop_codon:yes gene_type:complete